MSSLHGSYIHRPTAMLGSRVARAIRQAPVEVYPLFAVVAFSLSFMTYTAIHTSKDATDVSFHPQSNPRPWEKLSPEYLESYTVRASCIAPHTPGHPTHYPTSDSFFDLKFKPIH
ncbi:NADH-ubiquinone reductase complex 1 MLRQ subunit [Phaffia rhodozyma]|uniref:NADH-ubiquinone reductase complex 1 MLRQ subunit n=1 Tax=Phaffia rhodozyma TaxID=264483 RepID=A0A0F7SHW5_PHARH|nr:NADH-ubiquinone reductase complex 1 MLRQ subunit [Phaffia rhodozyma]